MDNPIQNLRELMLGDDSAASFLAMMVEVLHLWDDLIDKDKPVDDAAIHKAFYNMLVLLPRNSFYQRNFDHLNPILVNAITNWRIANELEKGSDEYELRIAYIIRSAYVDLVTQSAELIGGSDYAVQAGLRMRRFAHKEGWEGYLKNLADEKSAREGDKHVL